MIRLRRVSIRETEIITENFRFRNNQITAQFLEIDGNIIVSEHAPADNRTQTDLITNLSEKTSYLSWVHF